MNRIKVSAVAVMAAFTLAAPTANAFCGFFVAGADQKLFNNATSVVMMREGTRTVLSMQNDYQGPPESFAMVVPVPVVLQKENVKTLPKEVFSHIDALAAPRLVEYWEQDPCMKMEAPGGMAKGAGAAMPPSVDRASSKADLGVRIEAQFVVGEYEIVILSAQDSGGLDTWLKQSGYKIPEGAEPVLRPYVAQGMKFFVAKVDATKVKMENGHAALSPLRFHYDTDTFGLPVRLGLLNSNGTQDLIVHILARGKRYEVQNYPNALIPTNLDVTEATRDQFGAFYAALFDRTIEENPRAVVTEYAWDAQSCDPCPGPALTPGDINTLGADALAGAAPPTATNATWVATVKVSDIKAPPEDLERVRTVLARPERAQFRNCYLEALKTDVAPSGKVHVTEDLEPPGTPKVIHAEAAGGKLPAKVLACVEQNARGVYFGGMKASVKLAYTIDFSVRAPEPGEAPWFTPPPVNTWGFTLTRLHARYKKDALGEDLVFKEASAIEGGREGVAMSAKSTPASVNNFQGRYIIRHKWTGPVACSEPRYGIWGGPPNGQQNATKSATNSAFAPRGQVKAASFLAQPEPPRGPNPPSSTDAPPSASSKSCACGFVGAPSGFASLGLGALAAAAIYARRRRR
jgi:hypothetical protein